MTTKPVTVCLLAVLCAALIGCAKQPESPDVFESELSDYIPKPEADPNADIDIPPITPTDEETEEIKLSDEALYAPLLDSLKAQLSGEAEATDLVAFAEAIIASEDADPLSCVGYRLEDVNDDGVTELLIGEVMAPNLYADSTQGNALYAMYTLVEGEPKIVLEGWARNRYTRMAQKNLFYHEGSGGAMYGIFGVYSLQKGANRLTCEDLWFTAPKDDEQTQIGYYHNTTGELLKYQSEELDVTPDDFWSASARLGEQTVRTAFIPFSQYGNDVIVGTEDMFFDAVTHDDVYHTGDDGRIITTVAFASPVGVTDCTVYALTVTDIDEDGHLVCDKEPIVTWEALSAPRMVDMTFIGDLPAYGVSYTDALGSVKEYTVNVSGRDGTLILCEY